ncbi:MAG: carboxypeptidase regulatory-like domain-containing protein [Bacteroidota bacterium]
MLSSKCLIWLIIGVAMTVVLAGCGGGSNGSSVSPTTGSVEGTIQDFTSGLPLQGVSVTVGAFQAVTDANGHFLISGLAPGSYQLVIVPNPASHLVLPPGSVPPTVRVFPGDTTTLPSTIFLMDESDLPPTPPGS